MSKLTNPKLDLTPEQKAAFEAIRERTLHDRPGLDELIARGEVDDPVPQALYLELMALVERLKRRREELGLSLTDLHERSGLPRAGISKLENGWNHNPTLDTLYRYALGMGLHIEMTTREIPSEATPADREGLLANQLYPRGPERVTKRGA